MKRQNENKRNISCKEFAERSSSKAFKDTIKAQLNKLKEIVRSKELDYWTEK